MSEHDALSCSDADRLCKRKKRKHHNTATPETRLRIERNKEVHCRGELKKQTTRPSTEELVATSRNNTVSTPTWQQTQVRYLSVSFNYYT